MLRNVLQCSCRAAIVISMSTANNSPIWFALDATTGAILAGPTTRRKAGNAAKKAAPQGHGFALTSDAALAHGKADAIQAKAARCAAFQANQPTNA